jgi:hypothetical protein
MSEPSSLESSRTDWTRIDALRDEEIDLSDNPEVTPEMFAKAIVSRSPIAVPLRK